LVFSLLPRCHGLRGSSVAHSAAASFEHGAIGGGVLALGSRFVALGAVPLAGAVRRVRHAPTGFLSVEPAPAQPHSPHQPSPRLALELLSNVVDEMA